MYDREGKKAFSGGKLEQDIPESEWTAISDSLTARNTELSDAFAALDTENSDAEKAYNDYNSTLTTAYDDYVAARQAIENAAIDADIDALLDDKKTKSDAYNDALVESRKLFKTYKDANDAFKDN